MILKANSRGENAAPVLPSQPPTPLPYPISYPRTAWFGPPCNQTHWSIPLTIDKRCFWEQPTHAGFDERKTRIPHTVQMISNFSDGPILIILVLLESRPCRLFLRTRFNGGLVNQLFQMFVFLPEDGNFLGIGFTNPTSREPFLFHF